MEVIEKIRKSWASSHAQRFPNIHLAAVAGLSAVLMIVSLIPSNDVSASRQVIELALPPELLPNQDLAIEAGIIPNPLHINQDRFDQVSITVKPGDNLSLIFKRAGLSDRSMMNFINAAENSKRLTSMKPKHRLVFLLDTEKHIQKLTYIINKLDSYSYTINGSSYTFTETHINPDVHHASRTGDIHSSLYSAGIAVGMDDELIMELAEIFGWDIDFALDIRTGDSFRILYEERFLDGEKLENGAILTAEFVNQGQIFKAVRYVHSDGRAEYYTPEGRSMRKAFLRAPVDFRRKKSFGN